MSQHPLGKKGLASPDTFQMNSKLVIQNKKRLIQCRTWSIRNHKHLNKVTKERKMQLLSCCLELGKKEKLRSENSDEVEFR